jgi:O-acetylserine/cysteine efflux transporter
VKSFSSKDYLAALVVIVIWGSNFVVMKYGLESYTPFQLGAMRYVFAAFPLIFFVTKPALPFRFVVLYGLFQGVGQFGFVFTALIGWLVLHERLQPKQIAGLGLAALGIVCFVLHFTEV